MSRDSIEKMAGDAFREVGILIFVFANLDRMVSANGITVLWTFGALIFSALFWAAGAYIERRRGDD